MNIETKATAPEHFDTHHEKGEAYMCVQHNGQCSILVEIADSSPEEEKHFEAATKKAVEKLDGFLQENFQTSTAELFSGLHIRIGDNLTEGGGLAVAEDNRIDFDREKSAMSLTDAENFLVGEGFLDPGDWTGVMTSEKAEVPGSCLEYNTIHELAHILDGQTEGEKYGRVETSDSPTKYGRKKKNEAFAEAFTHGVYGMEIPDTARAAIRNCIENKKGMPV